MPSPAAQRFLYNIARGRSDAVQKALSENPCLALAQNSRYTALQAACLPGRDHTLVPLLLGAGANPNAVANPTLPWRHQTPLRLALAYCPEQVAALLEAGAQPQGVAGVHGNLGARRRSDPFLRSDIQWAAEKAPSWVPRFLDKGLEADARDPGRSPAALSLALKRAFHEGRSGNWSGLNQTLVAVKALADKVGVIPMKARVGFPDAHVLWSIRWLPGLRGQPDSWALVENLIDRMPFVEERNAFGRSFLVSLASMSREVQSGKPTVQLSDEELSFHREDLLQRFGPTRLGALALADGPCLLVNHLPLSSNVLDLSPALLSAFDRMRWWVEALGLPPMVRDQEGNTGPHLWARYGSVRGLANPEVTFASAALGWRWDIPNAANETAQELASQNLCRMPDEIRPSPQAWSSAMRWGVLYAQMPALNPDVAVGHSRF